MKISLQFFKLPFAILLLFLICSSFEIAAQPKPVGPLPSERQLSWQQLEYYAFIHFNMNTFTDMEWGTGGESPEQFDPSALDAGQWAEVAKEAGMKGIIITAKHHDGFCLWPTKTTEHSVKNSPWKDGNGDLIKDLAEACEEYGLQFGVYLSPWDRNNPRYGHPEYVAIFHEQLRELLTNYGDIFEVWFDGANGGTGYYGGANEERKIDNKTYYEWDKVTNIIRELQPNAVIFSDAGPDIRWVGNEEGYANETNWSIMRRDEIYPGWPRYKELRSGHKDGTHWLPAEADVSIRPGWYYHSAEDHQVKSLPHLLDIYYRSVGRNASLLLNLPVDDRGLVHETDVKQLMALRGQLDLDFKSELAKNARVTATDERGNGRQFGATNVNDGADDTYWSTNDTLSSASITFDFGDPTEVNRVLLQEYIPLGQRVKNFSVEAEVDGEWKEIDRQTTVGYKRILRFDPVTASKVRVNFLDAKGPLAISNIELYRAPNLLTLPDLQRNRDGRVTLSVPDKNIEVHYTLDGSKPTAASPKFEKPFPVDEPTTVKAIAYDPESGETTETALKRYDIAKKDWKVVEVSSGTISEAIKAIDENPDTFWATDEGGERPQELVIDLGKSYKLKGFTYWPIQERYPFGIITGYKFSVSSDAQNWKAVAEGEFGNVVNNRIEQTVEFEPTKGQYIKLRATNVDGDDFRTSFGEIGVITEKD
ncbi:alpha-L-fucosidase [Pricia sp. S334]|uniref:alpha-L-fucosidase n=2 Tax=Pricia mediterranea TaxID=3076079 RepID=A0ABU3L7C7_9FLAO|nr:alpha-L-fucosidase [Pricia sp. S334]MDT7829367.1 alpha-L-fucosidase [Pricia sp. S334]